MGCSDFILPFSAPFVREWKDLSSITIKKPDGFYSQAGHNLHEGFIPAGNIAYVKF